MSFTKKMWSYNIIYKKKSTISIQLLEPVIFIDSNLETSPVVRGTVHVKNNKRIMKNLYIHFHGTLKTQWKKGVMSLEKSVVSNGLLLFPNDNYNNNVNTTTTSCFLFEMPLPAGIPESIQCTEIQVNYTISATVTYHNNNKTTTTTIPIILARLPENGLLYGENHSTMIDSQLQPFLNWCQYRITIDKKAVAIGSKLPIKMEIIPCQLIRIKQVFLQLIERRVLKQQQQGTTTIQLCQFIYPTTSLVLPSKELKSHWQAQCEYQIPMNKLTHSTKDYHDFQVHHVLLVSLVVSLQDRSRPYTVRTISFQTPIDLLDGQFEQQQIQLSSSDGLPSYDCPVSIEEVEKLNQHGLYHIDYPPCYESLNGLLNDGFDGDFL